MNVSRFKVIAGYTLLIAALFLSLYVVCREMGNLMRTDEQDMEWADSLLVLIREKDANTRRMLRALNQAEERMLSAEEIEQIIARQDSAVERQRVQQRIISHRDTVVTKPQKKGFFRRLGEVFVPPKKDTAIQVNTSLEYAVDTLIEAYNPADSLREELRTAARQKQMAGRTAQRHKQDLERSNRLLTARIDTLLKAYEAEVEQQAIAETAYRQSVRQRSVQIVGGIAVGAVLLAAIFLIVIGRDISRSNRYRRELEEARRRAEELLAIRERLMLAITHDFKAPLGSIMGYADLLSRLTVDERQRLYIDHICTSSEHLLKLVTDLLDFHRLDLNKAEVHRTTFRPDRLIEEAHAAFEPMTAAKGLTFRCDIAPELRRTYICDPLRLKQIVNNLLSNAVKFTDKGEIALVARYESPRLVLSVSDTGKGMQPADRERIFQEFIRLPEAQGKEGFGLGLSIVRRLVQLLEGGITVDSEPNRGSTFTVSIPIYPTYHLTTDYLPTHNSPSEGSGGGFYVLLIDDDRIQLELTAAMLKESGIASTCCQQTDELLEALRNARFDVLLTDVQMPAINGFDLLTLLRASNLPQAKAIPVIAVTARSGMAREEFTAHGFAGCLFKPFTVAELLQEVGGQPDFSALTSYAGDDKDTARSILQSFRTETRQRMESLRRAVAGGDLRTASALSHKMIPLFTLIGAAPLVERLRKLEAANGTDFTEELKADARLALRLMEEVLKRVE